MPYSDTQQSIRDGRNKRLQSLASSTDNTLSSLTDSDSEYDDTYDDSRRSSVADDDSASILDSEAPMERERDKIQERIHRTKEGFKSSLKSKR